MDLTYMILFVPRREHRTPYRDYSVNVQSDYKVFSTKAKRKT
jgi:hypothetical protein